jgi:hypothetical protein
LEDLEVGTSAGMIDVCQKKKMRAADGLGNNGKQAYCSWRVRWIKKEVLGSKKTKNGGNDTSGSQVM